MRAKLPILSLLWLLGGDPALPQADAQVRSHPPPATGYAAVDTPVHQHGNIPAQLGEEKLERAILAMESYDSVSAKIRHTVHLYGKRLVGSGVYLEQRPGNLDPRLRMELKIQLGDQVSSFLQVSDGTYLWTYRKLLDDGTLTRVSIARVIDALERAGKMHYQNKMGHWAALGGLPRLLRGLHSTFNFDSCEQTQMPDRDSVQLPVWKLRGEWKPEKLAEVFSKDEKTTPDQGPIDLRKLPRHLPDQVVLFLGEEDLFPYRIDYLRGRPQSRTIVSMQLFEVSVNVPIHPTRFIYNPGDLKWSDQTKEFLKNLGLEE